MKIDGTQEKHCFTKFVQLGDTLFVNYIVTGDTASEKTTAKIWDPTNDVIYSDINGDEGEHEYDVDKFEGIYKLCFFPEQNKEHYLSLEFYTKNEKGHFFNMANDSKHY
jgi:hypothetical protein